jgi:hypothetical protein
MDNRVVVEGKGDNEGEESEGGESDDG